MDPFLLIVLIAGGYLAWNIGANDVANAMGTSVGSHALTLRQAVVIAAILEFSGAFFFGSHVSSTIQNGIIDHNFFAAEPHILAQGMLASLIASGLWLQVASYFGWPVSTTHTIVGAVVGFGMIVGGTEAIDWLQVGYILSSWIISPIMGGILALIFFQTLCKKILYQPDPYAATLRFFPYLAAAIIFLLSLSIVDSPLISFILSLLVALISFLWIQQQNHVANKPVALHPLFDELTHMRKEIDTMQSSQAGDVQLKLQSISDEIHDLQENLSSPYSPIDPHISLHKTEKLFSYLQILSACLMAFAHGANDVANAIGPLSAVISIISTGAVPLETTIPTEILAFGGLGIVVGLATWGWRVIETIGKKITELTPTRGFAAEFAAAITLLLATRLGLPVSTTHTLVGALLGIGLARGMMALNLTTVRHIILSWIITVPVGAILTVCLFNLFRL